MREWDREDLVRRVVQALDATERTVRAVIAGRTGSTHAPEPTVGEGSGAAPLVPMKVFGEASLLLRSVALVTGLGPRVQRRVDRLAGLLGPQVRGDDLLAALCLEPALALDHAFPHVQLTGIGDRDERIDVLLARCLEAAHAPERLPTRELEQHWLRGVWSGDDAASPAEVAALGRTCLAWPLDALGATTHDVYAFTHVVLYASDLGCRPVRLPRAAGAVTADADAALAMSLDSGNFDLTAELLWTWPMLGRPWSTTATFAFGVLTQAQDEYGFLPGPGYSVSAHRAQLRQLQDDYVLGTSYHTTLVMGILCAAALRPGCAPPSAVPGAAPTPTSPALADTAAADRNWAAAYAGLDIRQRAALEPLLIAIGLRRARRTNDVGRLRELLRVALERGLVDAPAPRQAVGLLRRSALLAAPSRSRIAADG